MTVFMTTERRKVNFRKYSLKSNLAMWNQALKVCTIFDQAIPFPRM